LSRDQGDIFETQEREDRKIPLAEKLRPVSLVAVRGEPKLIASDSLLAQMILSGVYHSFILWGSSGTGKTTIARSSSKAPNIAFVHSAQYYPASTT
jgi:putative ATPase